MKTAKEPIHAPHFLARRLLAKWAKNFRDPERLVLRRDRMAAALTEAQRRKLVRQIGDIASALRHAFQTQDEYERDWFLTWARSLNAQHCVDAESKECQGAFRWLKNQRWSELFFMSRSISRTRCACVPSAKPVFFNASRSKNCAGRNAGWPLRKRQISAVGTRMITVASTNDRAPAALRGPAATFPHRQRAKERKPTTASRRQILDRSLPYTAKTFRGDGGRFHRSTA